MLLSFISAEKKKLGLVHFNKIKKLDILDFPIR